VSGEHGDGTDRRIAVVGCGGAGQLHVDALSRAGIVPAALIDPDADRLARLGRRCPGAVLATSPHLVVDAFDTAIVAVPDREHAPMAIELLRAGKHVLVEKPMAGTRLEAEEMVAAADAAGRLVAVAHPRRHLPVWLWAHQVIRSGVLGTVERVDAAHGGRDDFVAASAGYVTGSAGGVIANQGAHTLDPLTWWFGPLTVVSCTDDARGGQEADASIELRAGDVPVHLELSRIRTLRNTVRICAARGLLEVALDHYQPRQLLAVPDGLDLPPFDGAVEDLAGQFDRQLRALTEALDGRWPEALPTGAQGVAVAGVIEGCYAVRSSSEPWWMRSSVERA
jgi:predicted dehydrogenase